MSDKRNTWPFHLLVETESGAKVYGEEMYQAFKARLMRELEVYDIAQPSDAGIAIGKRLMIVVRSRASNPASNAANAKAGCPTYSILPKTPPRSDTGSN